MAGLFTAVATLRPTTNNKCKAELIAFCLRGASPRLAAYQRLRATPLPLRPFGTVPYTLLSRPVGLAAGIARHDALRVLIAGVSDRATCFNAPLRPRAVRRCRRRALSADRPD